MLHVTLLQTGARHNYSMAQFLHQGQMLQRLYTDWAVGEHSILSAIKHLPVPASLSAKINRRMAVGIPACKISNLVARRLDNRVGQKKPWRILKADALATDIYYAQYYCGAYGLRETLPRSCKIISDVFTVPSTHRIVNDEAARFPEWNEPRYDSPTCEGIELFNEQMFADSDFLFCPAQSVIDDIAQTHPGVVAKCRLVPYGSSLSFQRAANPEPKRVLFAGSLTLRKGPQYLKQAADRVYRTDPSVTFVFAGSASDTVRNLMEGPNITILGQLSRADLQQEYLRADVFAFPSLAEGSAGTTLEALAAGVPLITTRSAGVDIVDGEAGVIVPERDCDALADAIVKVVNDRELRNYLSQGARRSAESYDLATWKATFLDEIRSASL